MTQEEIKDMMLYGERINVEYKEAFNEQLTLAYVWNGDEISNTILQQLLSLNSIEAGRLLHNLVDKGLHRKDALFYKQRRERQLK